MLKLKPVISRDFRITLERDSKYAIAISLRLPWNVTYEFYRSYV